VLPLHLLAVLLAPAACQTSLTLLLLLLLLLCCLRQS
jgi:hypothetical protein